MHTTVGCCLATTCCKPLAQAHIGPLSFHMLSYNQLADIISIQDWHLVRSHDCHNTPDTAASAMRGPHLSLEVGVLCLMMSAVASMQDQQLQQQVLLLRKLLWQLSVQGVEACFSVPWRGDWLARD